MSSPGSNQPRGPEPRDNAGAYRVAEDRRRRPWWLLALLGLLLLALLLFLLSRCGADDPATGTAPATSASAAATSATAAASSPATASAPASSATPGSTTSAGTGGAGSAAPSGAATESPVGTATGTAAATASRSPSGAGTGTTTSGAGAGAGTGALTAAGTSLLPLSSAAGTNGDLSQYAGQAVTARGVQVQSVPADEGFWVGTSEQDRVWVQLTGEAGESSYQVQEGDIVDFTGTMRPTPRGFADRVGVDDDEGADQLQAQRQHIEARKSAVQLSR